MYIYFNAYACGLNLLNNNSSYQQLQDVRREWLETAMAGQNVLPYEYKILHSNFTDDNGLVTAIVRMNEPGFKTDKHDKCSVAVTLEERFIEVLIFKKNEKGKVIKRYKCVERTSPYDTDDVAIKCKDDTVLLKLKKRSEEPWSATPFNG
ncbi:uncharacterized protein LOC117335504 [Pecten maximus]|uniref:uncharacterized protein LOC117335504 n=1 Tax=Pecten maximus TaxID=6579 RepID=UPI0014589784|nr:uncharacterized protein LOC117335504 [Pecten maximus]